MNNLILNKKSLMYKIISLGFPVYMGDDEEEFLITALMCNDCGEIWRMSRSECIYCGTENPHIYECSICGNHYSITRATKKCCRKTLSKVCINKNCISNTNSEIKEYYNSLGGIFEISNSGATLNEMRCKHCGCKNNKYKSILIKLVKDINDEQSNSSKCLVNRKNKNEFIVKYNNKTYNFKTIDELLKTTLNIKSV